MALLACAVESEATLSMHEMKIF